MQITEELIRQLVIEVVDRLERKLQEEALLSTPSREKFVGKLLTAPEVEYFARQGIDLLVVEKKTVITPLAKERCSDLGVQLEVCT